MKNPVLILGWIPRIVVAIARSLHAYGVPVDVANSAAGPPIRSRAVREVVRLPDPARSPAAFVNELRRLILRRGHDMLIPTDDPSLAAVVEHYNDLKDLLHVACPPPAITRLVLNKGATLEIAQKHGIRVPSTRIISHTAEFEEVLRTVNLPWILKPAEKELQEEEFKRLRIATAEDLRKRFPQPRAFSPNILLQEYCQGAGVGIEMLIAKGECRAVFQHRRLKELPYDGGVAVIAIAEPPDSALVESSVILLRALQWEGVAMVEFKVNPGAGGAVLMEVNGRYWGTIALPILAGVDFPLLHWKLVHGEPFDKAATSRPGTKWRWTMGYIARFHDVLLAAPRSPAARRAFWDSLLDFSADFGFGIHDPMLRPSDPILVVNESLRTVQHLLASDLGALRRRLRFRGRTG